MDQSQGWAYLFTNTTIQIAFNNVSTFRNQSVSQSQFQFSFEQSEQQHIHSLVKDM